MIEYSENLSSQQEIINHLYRCDGSFIPALSDRVVLTEYSAKLSTSAKRFEAWEYGLLVGLVAAYLDAPSAYISSVSVLEPWRGKGVASKLLKRCIAELKSRGVEVIGLEVDPSITELYAHIGFIKGSRPNHMELKLPARDFDAETHNTATAKYAYDFDLEVMHPMMIRTFEPWFVDSPWIVERTPGNCLELGSFEGAFTQRLHDHFSDITCVEASGDALVAMMRQLRGTSGILVHDSTFEQVKLGKQYDNIFMTNVLEHVTDPVRVLKRVNDEWLAPGGRFFLACPNAHAASRQIAFHMGKLKSLHGVTNDEFQHGHHRTYSLDLLECHARNAGLKVIHRGGIFFKPLANFQIDKAKAAGIIDDAYLEGCYALGQVYPDLCASIYLICEKGDLQ